MWRNFIIIALRSFLRNKAYTLLNLLGLTVGLMVFILITLYVDSEFSFDGYHKKKDQIYRVVKETKDNFYQGNNHFAVTPAPLAPTLMADFPEVIQATRIMLMRNRLIGAEDETFLEQRVYASDPETFKIFTHSVVEGSQEGLLDEKNTAVISTSFAHKYFGKTDVVGKVIRYQDEHPFVVTGVIEDMPKNSHFRMDVILHYESIMELTERSLTHWNNNSFFTYLLLKENFDPEELEVKFPAMREKYADDKMDEDGQDTRYYLQQLTRIHQYSKANFDIGTTTDANKLYIYLSIAVLILCIACFNYVNLATARSLRRAKEVGIRKVVGAYRNYLTAQFLVESLILSFVSIVFAIACIYLVLPSFAEFVDLELSLDYLETPKWLIIHGILFILIGLSAGSYPALILSSVKPIIGLKGKTQSLAKKSSVRNILVIAQFAISGILIICTLIVSQQLNFIQNKDMGYEKDQIVVLRIHDRQLIEKLDVFKNELEKVPGVKMVASSSSLPNDITSSTRANWEGRPEGTNIRVYRTSIDDNFLDLYEMDVVLGRGFDKSKGDNEQSMLINESAAKALDWDDPIGKQMITGRDRTARIVGVIKDYHQHSLHLDITAMQLLFDEKDSRVSVKIASDDVEQVLSDLERVYLDFTSKYPFSYTFFDEEFNKAYKTEQKTAGMAVWSTALTILIACLGLYGLAMYAAEQRLKEVGIRKTLGASISNIVMLLSRSFLAFVLLAYLISVPISYYVMMQWLQDFKYHIAIDIPVFAYALVGMLLIGGLTIGYRTLQAASSNPVDVLKDE